MHHFRYTNVVGLCNRKYTFSAILSKCIQNNVRAVIHFPPENYPAQMDINWRLICPTPCTWSGQTTRISPLSDSEDFVIIACNVLDNTRVWHSVEWQFKFKIVTLTFNTLETGLNLTLPSSFVRTLSRALCCSLFKLHQVPPINLRFGLRSFRVSAPTLCSLELTVS